MSVSSAGTTTRQPDLPRVNLIPPEISEARDFKRLQFGLAALVALALIGAGAMYAQGRSAEHNASDSLATAQADQQAAESQLHSLQYIKVSAANVAAAEATLTQVRSTNVDWSDTLADLSVQLPSNVWYTGLTVAEKAQPGTYLNSTSVPNDVATVTLKGYGRSHDDVAAWLNQMNNIPYFTGQTFSTSKEGLIGQTPVVQFSSTVTVTNAAIKACDKPGVC